MADSLLTNFCTGAGLRKAASISIGTGNTSAITAGAYPVGGSPYSPTGGAQVYRTDLDDAGLVNPFISADGGITLTRFSASGCAGTFSAVMVSLADGGSRSTLHGTFDVPAIVCP